jgi:hypothetical protein
LVDKLKNQTNKIDNETNKGKITLTMILSKKLTSDLIPLGKKFQKK